jgi:hypothetical protein
MPAAPASSIDRPPADNRLSLETLPANLTANLTIGIDAVTWRGAAIRQSKLDLSLANREITVSQLSALLPGNSDVAVFGFVTEKDALPQFDGTVEMTSSDLRAALDWLGLSTKEIAGDRLRNASLNARLSARPDVVSATDLRARFDATQIDGALTANIAAHPSFGANLTIDRVNLDAYMPSADEKPAPAAKPDEQGSAARESNPTPALPNGSFAGLSALNGFNANLRARVGSVMFKNLPFNDVRIAASLADGTLDLKSASIGDLVGVTASASGVIDGLASAEPVPHGRDQIARVGRGARPGRGEGAAQRPLEDARCGERDSGDGRPFVAQRAHRHARDRAAPGWPYRTRLSRCGALRARLRRRLASARAEGRDRSRGQPVRYAARNGPA